MRANAEWDCHRAANKSSTRSEFVLRPDLAGGECPLPVGAARNQTVGSPPFSAVRAAPASGAAWIGLKNRI
jgi:hypothetical protein